ncbi:MAG: hypothetical protein Q4A18_03180 [Rikenellaceae bacterium]|nr:hypothetical protein [Rikenellaceae bacterium]
MKQLYKFAACAFAAMLLVNCTNDNLEQPVTPPAQVGDEIMFGGRAGFASDEPSSRTEYSGKDYTVDGQKYELINWIADDKVEIYSPTTSNGKNAHYNVVSNGQDYKEGDQNDYAYLTRIGDSSLQWADAGVHTFYAAYPSQLMFQEPTTVDMGFSMTPKDDNVELAGTIPDYQAPIKVVEVATGYEAKPDMRYAYMVAGSKATAADGVVGLTFMPIVTAMEVELAFNPGEEDETSIMIGEILVKSSSKPLAGPFTATMTPSNWNGTTITSIPDCTVPEGATTSKAITVSTYINGQPVKLTTGQSLKFTVFMLPNQDITDLSIAISDTGATFREHALTGLTIKKQRKSRVKQLQLPTATFEMDASNWMKELKERKPEISMRRLSLPGTGGSFSYNYTGSNKKYYQSQTLNLDDQWKMGIRAYEVIVDRPSRANTSLGGEDVRCNNESVGVTFNDVINTLATKVSANPEECAVVILTYQPRGGWTTPARRADNFAGSLNTWYNAYTNKGVFLKYTPDLKLKNAGGKIMILVRMNQTDEPEGGNRERAREYFAAGCETLKGTPFVIIDGCGTGKDRWGARGYKRDGVTFPHISNDYSGANVFENFMSTAATNYPFASTSGYATSHTMIYDRTSYTLTRPGLGEAANFGFATADESVTCYYQEWQRVVPASAQYGSYYWFESYTEKLDNANTTYDLAVDDNPDYQSYIFVNSLCGYMVVTGYSDSYTYSTGSTYGGSGGDIKALADKITPDFYAHVLDRSLDNTTGPTGIVLMDYVSKDPNAGGAYALPGLIIANNLKSK